LAVALATSPDFAHYLKSKQLADWFGHSVLCTQAVTVLAPSVAAIPFMLLAILALETCLFLC
jgi:hypothetical protein